MANNYLQFSEVIQLKSEAEKEWVEWYLGIIPGSDESDAFEKLSDQSEYERQLERYNLQTDDLSLNFQWNTGEENDLWIYADESGDVDNVALFVQDYLRKFAPDESFGITYASTCSKMRVGEFGGGAAFVTSDEIDWVDAGSWVAENRKRFKMRNQKRDNTNGFTVIELMIVIAIIGIICALVFGVVGGNCNGKNQSSAEDNAQRFIKNMELDVAKVQCNGTDSDGDGYVSCMFKMKSGEMKQFECAGWTWNGEGCRIPKLSVNAGVNAGVSLED